MYRHRRLVALVFFLALGCLGLAPDRSIGAQAGDKKPPAEAVPSSHVIKSEANVVLVNVAITDRKQQYLKDLEQKEFHVFEDGAEQNIVSFSREADIKPEAPGSQRYMVLFFDNSTVRAPADQAQEREAAAKFVKTAASPNSPNLKVAVVDFGGTLDVVQNFTSNGDQLNNAVKNARFSAVETNAAGGHGGREQADFATRNLLLAIRDIARMLSPIQGRKVMILFSAGFATSVDRQADFQDTLDALNKANVGVYAVGTLGLAANGGNASVAMAPQNPNGQQRRQQPNMGGGVGGPGPGAGANQEILRTFAAHTGGFPILNTNDLLGGMEQISADMQESYILGYVPLSPTHDGSYHKIRVKVDRKGADVRARDGYFDSKNPDLLAAKPEGKALEARAAAPDAGDIPVSLLAPYFYLHPGVAIVNLSLSIPGSSLEFEKEKGAFHSHLDILGIAYREDGSVAARFSDTVKMDLGKEEEEEAAKVPFTYQKCFKIAPGTYKLKVLLSGGGQKFGKGALPLLVDSFSGDQLTVGGPAFGDRIVKLAPQAGDIDETLLEGTKPLIASGVEIVPSTSNHFVKSVPPFVYLEVYDPELKSDYVAVGLKFKIVDPTTTQTIFTSNTTVLNPGGRKGDPLLPVGFRLPIDGLPAGKYRFEFWGRDSVGNTSPVRSGEISVE